MIAGVWPMVLLRAAALAALTASVTSFAPSSSRGLGSRLAAHQEAEDRRVLIYDTTLRDGTQGEAVSASVDDKLRISARLNELGVDFIEAGWPGSNPKDVEFFDRAQTELDEATRLKLVAFGSTRRKATDASADPQLQALVASGCPRACIVAKSSAWQVTEILGVSLEENLAMIRDSVSWLTAQNMKVMVDMEHFFDGHKSESDYSIECCRAAAEAGAEAVVLCDTNGGSMPWEIEEASRIIMSKVNATVGVHVHNDAGLAVANSMAAVKGGASLVQGTINGIGERTGNANLCTIAANLELKMSMPTSVELTQLTSASRFVDELLNRSPSPEAPYVGASAFAHKGGLHVAAVKKHSKSYEHIEPALVGNQQRVLVSELSGRANIWSAIEKGGLVREETDVPVWQKRATAVLGRVKQLESLGYSFEGANASVHLVLLHASPAYCPPFTVKDYSVTIADDDLDSMSRAFHIGKRAAKSPPTARATIKIKIVGEDPKLDVAEGNGPIDAIFEALKCALGKTFPSAVEHLEIADYKVRILDPKSASKASTRVLISFKDTKNGAQWSTSSVDGNIVSASANALVDGFEYAIIEHADFCALCDDSFDPGSFAQPAVPKYTIPDVAVMENATITA